ncbi:MAG TPA: hypothetical protein VG537_11010, partial [Candidatus Kapabacteria bacterium]|nr:hypothetical protein [Candidatus Kapabacteria bacterium]
MKLIRYSLEQSKVMKHSLLPVVARVLLSVVFCAGPVTAQWMKEANVPGQGRDAASEFSIGSKAYFGGGYIISNVFYEYNPLTNTWTKKANLPIGKVYRAFGLSFSIGSKGYVAMGQSDTSNGGQPSVTNDVWQYDPTTDQWTRKADFPGAARDGAMVFVVNGKAYVGAGVDAAYNYLGDFYEYDPMLDTWTEKADLPSGPIGFPMAFSIDSLGYMVCGGNPTEQTQAYSYNPSTDMWSSISSFPGIAREAGVGFSIDSLGYVGLGEA